MNNLLVSVGSGGFSVWDMGKTLVDKPLSQVWNIKFHYSGWSWDFSEWNESIWELCVIQIRFHLHFFLFKGLGWWFYLRRLKGILFFGECLRKLKTFVCSWNPPKDDDPGDLVTNRQFLWLFFLHSFNEAEKTVLKEFLSFYKKYNYWNESFFPNGHRHVYYIYTLWLCWCLQP